MSEEEVINELQKEAYLEEKRRQAMIVTGDAFVLLSRNYLSRIPLAGAAAFRLKNGEEGIIIHWDHFAASLGEDFSDCVDYEIEHEAEELWRTRGKTNVDSFGPDHYDAAKAATRKAHREGSLDRYLHFKTVQLRFFKGLGDDKAMEELAFYREYADELRSDRVE